MRQTHSAWLDVETSANRHHISCNAPPGDTNSEAFLALCSAIVSEVGHGPQGEIRVDGRCAEPDQRRHVMNITSVAGLCENAGPHTTSGPDQVVVDGGGCECSGSNVEETVAETGTHSLVDGDIRGVSDEDPDEGPNFRYCRTGDELEVNLVDIESGFSVMHAVMDLQ